MAATEETEKKPARVLTTQGLHIGWALEWARKRVGMTRQQVATAAKCHKSWISRLENGENSPSYQFVLQLTRLYRMNLETIRCGNLPERLKHLKSTSAKKWKSLQSAVSKIDGGQAALSLAESGVSLPDDRVMRAIAWALGQQDLRVLLYQE